MTINIIAASVLAVILVGFWCVLKFGSREDE